MNFEDIQNMQLKKVNNASVDVPPTFVALVLHLYGGKGHVFSYQKAVGEAVRLNGWDYLAAISPDPVIKIFPSEWRIAYVNSGVLDYEGGEITKLLRSFCIWSFVSSMYKLFCDLLDLLKREINAIPNQKIIFMEAFNPLQLLSLVFALMFVKRNRIAVWLLYRGGPNWGGSRHRLLAQSFAIMFRAINPILELVVGRNNLLLLTDSDKLRLPLQEYYKRPVHVVPIPHTPALAGEMYMKTRSQGKEIACWWPGAPRADKGLDIIRRLASEKNEQAHKIKLFVAESANLTTASGGIKIEAVKDKLDRLEYERMFFSSNLILLPYDQEIYNESTSGIFTECIVAGAIPLVTKDTWMAYELSKHELSELIIDWNDKGIVDTLIKISSDIVIRKKVKNMQICYKKYHNVAHFAEVLNLLYIKLILRLV